MIFFNAWNYFTSLNIRSEVDMESPDSKTLKGPGDEEDDQIVSTLGEIGDQTYIALLNKK